ncbi:uncharacterized protein HaLaN_13340, partial [Haematococcus lacustris]
VIEVLKKRGEKGAMILATSELGDVHAHFGNWGAATAAWSSALDTLVGPYQTPRGVRIIETGYNDVQVLRCWRKVLDGRTPANILESFGVHGCLMAGGCLLGKLARYAHFSNCGQKLEAARMAAVLLSAIFAASACHPQRPHGFATYVPRELWEGVDLFTDPYRCPITDLVLGLEVLVGVLLDADLALQALP